MNLTGIKERIRIPKKKSRCCHCSKREGKKIVHDLILPIGDFEDFVAHAAAEVNALDLIRDKTYRKCSRVGHKSGKNENKGSG